MARNTNTEATPTVPTILASNYLSWRNIHGDCLTRPSITESALKLPRGLYDCVDSFGKLVVRIKISGHWSGETTSYYANRYGDVSCWFDAMHG